MANRPDGPDRNPDPITNEPGAHPIGAGVGAALAGAAAGAAGGAIAGPVGTIAGAAVGAIAGGYAGKAVEEYFDPTVEDAYWRENYKKRPYVAPGTEYDSYRPAYQYGWESFSKDTEFDAVENELEREWRNRDANTPLPWGMAKPAVRDAWDRVKISTADTQDLPLSNRPK